MGIRTFSVRIGQKRIFHAARKTLMGLLFLYGGGFIRGSIQAPSMMLKVFRGMVGTMSILGGFSVRNEAKMVNPEDSTQVYNYYMHLWKLFYLSYFALPFAR